MLFKKTIERGNTQEEETQVSIDKLCLQETKPDASQRKGDRQMADSDFRRDVREVEKEGWFVLRKVLKWGIPIIIVLALLGFLAQSLGIISLDIQREVIQRSQQYVETKVNLLNKLHNDWLQLDAEIAELRADDGNEGIVAAKRAQQKNTANRIRTEAGMIPDSQVPDSVKAFIAAHPR